MTTPGDDPRPAPQYGEYATPEQQAALIRQSGGHASLPDEPTFTPHPPTAPATTSAARPTRTADRIITFALLAYGLITVISAIPQLLDFTGFVETWMDVAGIDAEFTNVAAGQTWGLISALVFAGGWIVTALLSWWALARRRVAWWIPLVGAIVTFIAVSICLSVPLLGDPAVVQHLTG